MGRGCLDKNQYLVVSIRGRKVMLMYHSDRSLAATIH